MDKLSPEIISLIGGELCDSQRSTNTPRLGPYATISRTWQDLIEARTFAHIENLKLEIEEVSTFASVFKDTRRQTFLRNLDCSFTPSARGNSRAGHVANSAALGRALTFLFTTMSTWKTGGQAITLTLRMEDGTTPPRRYFMLDQPDTVLPPVPCITYLRLFSWPRGALHPTAEAKIVSALPGLNSFDYQFCGQQPKRAQLGREIRRVLGESLHTLKLPQLQRLEMAQEPSLFLCNHSLNFGDLCDEDGVDPLNSAIYALSQRTPLRRLDLKDFLVSRELFTGSDRTSTWPTLQEFDYGGLAIAPSGKWYWTGDPNAVERGSTRGFGSDIDSDSTDEHDDSGTDDDSDRDAILNGYRPMHEWRVEPDWAMLSPLLVDMACAVQRMPNLQRGTLYLDNNRLNNVCFNCASPGFRYNDFDQYEPRKVRTCRLFVGTPSEEDTWLTLDQIPEEVRLAWREWLGDDGVMETGPYWVIRNI